MQLLCCNMCRSVLSSKIKILFFILTHNRFKIMQLLCCNMCRSVLSSKIKILFFFFSIGYLTKNNDLPISFSHLYDNSFCSNSFRCNLISWNGLSSHNSLSGDGLFSGGVSDHELRGDVFGLKCSLVHDGGRIPITLPPFLIKGFDLQMLRD